MKLELINVSKIHNSKQQTYDIRNANLTLAEGKNIALLSAYGRSSISLLNLISGIEHPTKGKVLRKGIFSAPIGDPSYFHRELSGEENIRFICKIYGQKSNQVLKEINEFASLSIELKQKAKAYNPDLRRKIAISASLIMKSDIYQLRGALNHPQQDFNMKIQKKLEDISKHSTLIVVAADQNLLQKYAERSILIDSQGCLKYFDDVQSGIEAHKALSKGV